ncbi:MAG: helix-turn-helix domain-containing protein [Clostridia bacterium]|nr:helix-turn-helix domain-containing protein [Clostridia bacterium]
MDYVELGKRIRVERTMRKWTQARLANEVSLSVSFLGHVERGTRKASMETVVGIANALQVSLESLLADSLLPLPQTTPYDPLNLRQRKALRQIVEHLSADLDNWADAGEK